MVLGKLFDPSLLWWRLLRVAADATCAVLVYALVRPRGGARWALAAWAAVAVTVAQPTSANPTGPALAFALAALLFATRARPGWAGAMAALAAFWRPDVGAIAALAAAATLLLARVEEEPDVGAEGGGATNGRVEGRGAARARADAATAAAAGAGGRGGEGRRRGAWRDGRRRGARRDGRRRGARRGGRRRGARRGGRRRAAAAPGGAAGPVARAVVAWLGPAAPCRRALPAHGDGRAARALRAVPRRGRPGHGVGRARRPGHARRGVVAAAVPGLVRGRGREGLPVVAGAVRGAADPRARRRRGSAHGRGSWSSGSGRRSTSSRGPTSSTRRACW